MRPDELRTLINKGVDDLIEDNVITPFINNLSTKTPHTTIFTDALFKVVKASKYKSMQGNRPIMQFVGAAVYHDEISEAIFGYNANRFKDSILDGTFKFSTINNNISVEVRMQDTPRNVRYLKYSGFNIAYQRDNRLLARLLLVSYPHNSANDAYSTLMYLSDYLPNMVRIFNTITRRLDRCRNISTELPNFQ